VIVFLLIAIAASLVFMSTARKVSSSDIGNPNVAAFLAMIRHCEIGERYSNPYNVYYGGKIFSNTSDHPVNTGECQRVITKWGTTSAAGAYQFEVATWNGLGGKDRYGDFGPGAQDMAATELIAQTGALDDVENGNFFAAVQKVGHLWASLPSSTSGQPSHTWDEVALVYGNAGGTIGDSLA